MWRIAGLLGLCACEPSDPCAGDASAPASCASDFALRVGTGEQVFEPIADTMWLHLGAQGLQHLVVSLSADLSPSALVLDRALVRLEPSRADGAALPTLEVGVGFRPAGETVEVVGVLLVFDDPAVVVGQTVTLAATLEPVGLDEVGHAEVTAEVQWAPGDAP